MKVLGLNVVGIEDVHQIIYSVVGDKDNVINRAKVGRDFLDASLGSVDDFEKYLVDLLEDVRKQKELEEHIRKETFDLISKSRSFKGSL